MRIGMYMPYVDRDGKLLDGPGVAKRAQMVEAAGLNSFWTGDHTPIPGDTARDMPDAILYLAIGAMATTSLELGTCIWSLPLRNKYDAAQRFFTLETIAKGRFTIGVGTGSQKIEYDAAGLDWDDRFRRMADHMEGIHEIFEGKAKDEIHRQHPTLDPKGTPVTHEQSEDQGEPWGKIVGPPRFALGSWHSDKQLKRAATEYSGWLASGHPGTQFGGWRKVFSESIKKYRDFGGKRAIAATVSINLGGPVVPLDEMGAFQLQCTPSEATERLHIMEEMGFDDIILNITDRELFRTRKGLSRRYDFTSEDLEQVRSLLPADHRDYHDV